MIDKILRSIQNIPAFPITITRISEILGNDDYSVSEVVDLIKYDPAMAANVVKMSNSAYLAARHRISTVRDAVIYIGQLNLIKLVQTAGVSRFYDKAKRGYAATANELWEHAVAVAIMSQILSRKIMKREDERLYLAALLHDVGKVIMGEFVYESLDEIMALIGTGKYSFLEAEEEIIGIDHAKLGGKIAAYWRFPKEIENAMAYHHRPDFLEEEDDNLCWLVYLADQICLIMGISGGMDDLAHRGISEVMKKFEFYEKDLEMGMIQLFEDLDRARDLINIS